MAVIQVSEIYETNLFTLASPRSGDYADFTCISIFKKGFDLLSKKCSQRLVHMCIVECIKSREGVRNE